MIYSESKKGWKGINICQMFKDKLKFDIAIDTDVNVAGLGEFQYGAGKYSNNLVYLTIGTGIGGGLLVNGKIHHGIFHLEMGHIPIPNPESFDSVCRVHDNCWDGLASASQISERKLREVEEASKSVLSELSPLYQSRPIDYLETVTVKDMEIFSQVILMCERSDTSLDLFACIFSSEMPRIFFRAFS